MIIYVIWNTTTFPFSETIRVTLTLVIQKSSIIRVRNGDIPPREQDSRSRTRLCRVMTINLWLTRGGISSSLTSKYWMIIFLAFCFSYYIVIVENFWHDVKNLTFGLSLRVLHIVQDKKEHTTCFNDIW